MTNPRADRVRDVAKLGGRPARLKRREFLVEGIRGVREAVRADLEAGGGLVRELYVTEDCLAHWPELGDSAAARLASEDVLRAMSDAVTTQGAIAVCRFVDVSLERVLASRPRLVAVLEQVQDPGNAGTILRAADAAGADAVVLTAGSVDIYNPKTVRSTVGSLFHVPVVIGADPGDLPRTLRAAGLQVLAADGYGSVDLDELQDAARPGAVQETSSEALLERPTAWFFGNEGAGLDAGTLRAADHRVAVPIYGLAESLNVGTAATVCLYASARAQRRTHYSRRTHA